MKEYLEKDVNEIDNLAVSNDEEENGEPERLWDGPLEEMEMHGLIGIDSFVAIRAPPESLELFFIMKVIEKRISEETIKDKSNEHCILKGEPFLIGKWVSFQKEKKNFAYYKEAKDSVENEMIHVSEVFSIDVLMDDDLKMNIIDYRLLYCKAF